MLKMCTRNPGFSCKLFYLIKGLRKISNRKAGFFVSADSRRYENLAKYYENLKRPLKNDKIIEQLEISVKILRRYAQNQLIERNYELNFQANVIQDIISKMSKYDHSRNQSKCWNSLSNVIYNLRNLFNFHQDLESYEENFLRSY